MEQKDGSKDSGHLTEEEKERYSRQMMIPSIGARGQDLLRRARICIAGVGGLGSVSAYYLAAAGIGHLRLVDRDVVELSNLNRQILHWTEDLGTCKTDSASDKLARLNPDCLVEAIHAGIDEKNVFEIVDGCNVIIDALDNIKTRKLLNIASVRKSVPMIYGGVEGFTGMASTFLPGRTACFECLFSHITEDDRSKGVIGALPAIIGSIQALEAIKIVTGLEVSLAGKLIYFSGLNMKFHEIEVDKNPRCPVCGT